MFHFDALNSSHFAHIAPRYLPEPHASLLNGMLLGISLKHTGAFYLQTIDAGLVHLVVVSGSNISLIAESVLGSLFFISKKAAIASAFITIALFTVLVGFQPPVMRAFLTNSLLLLGLLTGRPYRSLYSLLLTAVISICIWPQWLSSFSFYLTYLAASGIILFAKPQKHTSTNNSLVTKAKTYLHSELRTSIAAQIFITPLIYFYFGRISFISVISTLLVSWAIVPIMIFGFLTILSHYIHTRIAEFVSILLYPFLHYIIVIIDLLS